MERQETPRKPSLFCSTGRGNSVWAGWAKARFSNNYSCRFPKYCSDMDGSVWVWLDMHGYVWICMDMYRCALVFFNPADCSARWYFLMKLIGCIGHALVFIICGIFKFSKPCTCLAKNSTINQKWLWNEKDDALDIWKLYWTSAWKYLGTVRPPYSGIGVRGYIYIFF